uniref:Secreted protein n=1 Tax=Knipowitschia caucasica TaxID=637954 RepID=A0AAV2KLY2_KNICA
MHFLWLCFSQIALTDERRVSLSLATPMHPSQIATSLPLALSLSVYDVGIWQPVVSARNRYANGGVSSAVSGEQRASFTSD